MSLSNWIMKMRARGISLTSVDRNNAAGAWDARFDILISRERRKQVRDYSDQFRWHLFSFKILPSVEGAEAKKLFDHQRKSTLYLFTQYGELACRIENAGTLTAEDLDVLHECVPFGEKDMYLYPPEGGWTYVLTHESMCGPYFYPGIE